MKKEDRRAKMTKDFLKHGLIEMLKTKNINYISVKALCENADVNRSTFYKHYSTVTELYEDIINDVTETLRSITENAGGKIDIFSTDYIGSILDFAESNRDLFLVLLSENGNVRFGEYLIRHTDNLLVSQEQTELSRYCNYFIVSGMISIIWKWLNEENRMPSHKVAVVISSLLAHGIKRASVFSDSLSENQQIIRK